MLSTFCGPFDVPHRKKADKKIPAIVDMYNQSMGDVGCTVLCAQIEKTRGIEEVELYVVHAKRLFMHYVFKDISACN